MDSRNRIAKSAPAVFIASLITVVLIHWLPLFVLFFTVPLFVVYFIKGKEVFSLAVLVTFILDCVTTIVLMSIQGSKPDFSEGLLIVFQSGFILLPLLCMLFPGTVRIRYRLFAAGALSALAWCFLFLGTSMGKMLTDAMHSEINDAIPLFYSMFPKGPAQTAVQEQISPDKLYDMIMLVLSYSVLPLCVSLYTVGALASSFIAGMITRTRRYRFYVSFFHVEYFVFLPLIFGMCGIIASRFFQIGKLDILFWNVFISAGLFFLVQGYGIMVFFLNRMKSRSGRILFPLLLLSLVLFMMNGLVIISAALLILGVMELFVPLRSRFNNKDIIDPTPGRGNDQNQ
jgi:hypothetical protein